MSVHDQGDVRAGVSPNVSGTFTLPPELFEALAVRVAELVTAQVEGDGAEGYLDAEAAAEYLAVPKSQIYQLTHSGRVRHYRHGRRVLFRAEDLDALLEVQEIGE